MGVYSADKQMLLQPTSFFLADKKPLISLTRSTTVHIRRVKASSSC